MHLFATLSKPRSEKENNRDSTLDDVFHFGSAAIGAWSRSRAEESDHCPRWSTVFFSLSTRPIGCDRATKSAAEETPFTRSTGELFLNSCLSSRVCGTPPSTSPINRSTPIYNSLQLEKRSLAFLFSLLVFFVCLFFFEPVDVTRS